MRISQVENCDRSSNWWRWVKALIYACCITSSTSASVLHDRPRRAVDALVVPAHQDLEQRGFPGTDPPDDFRVRQRRERRRRNIRFEQSPYPLESSAPRFVAEAPACHLFRFEALSSAGGI